MKNKKIRIWWIDHRDGTERELEVSEDLPAEELIKALNSIFHLGIDMSDPEQCYLKTEWPIARIRGSAPLRGWGLMNGSEIHYF